MNKGRLQEVLFLHLITGFLIGLAISIILNVLLIRVEGMRISFQSVASLHHDLPIIYFLDFLFLPGIILGFYTGRARNRLNRRMESYILEDVERNNYIKKALQDLTKGNLNQTLERRNNIDPEMIERLKDLQATLSETRIAEQKTREAERQRNWTSHGLAEFGDILRSHSDNLESLSYSTISNLVRYLDINQGGFFVVEENEGIKTLKMIACHAYDRKKFPDQVVSWGDGLIGAAAIEKKTYYTDKIPDGYLSITSGLGKANPRHLLIVPMVINEQLFGVFELASFRKFEDYQIQLVERVAENTATTLNIMQNNMRTAQLLIETQDQARQLALQEERVRQNVEELKNTQIEAAQQSEQFISFTNTVNHTMIRAEYNPRGELLYANTKFLKKFGYSGNKEVDGKNIMAFIHHDDQAWFKGIWNKLSSGGAHYEGYMRHITKLGLDLWTMATYTCERVEDGSVEKIQFIAIDNTKQKEESLKYEGHLNALNKLSVMAEFGIDGKLLFHNDLFKQLVRYDKREIAFKNVFDFIPTNEQERFNEIWEQVISGIAYRSQLKMQGKFETDMWLRVAFSVVKDLYGEVDKIIFIGFDITKEKELELSIRDQNLELKETEQQLRLQGIDLKKELEVQAGRWDREKTGMRETISLYQEFYESLPYPVLMINNQSYILNCNKAAEKYFKVRKKQIISLPVTNVLDKNQEEDIIQNYIDASKETSAANHIKVKLKFENGTEDQQYVSIYSTEVGSSLANTLLVHL